MAETLLQPGSVAPLPFQGQGAPEGSFWQHLLAASGNLYRRWETRADQVQYEGDWMGLLGNVVPGEEIAAWLELLHAEDQEGYRRYLTPPEAGASGTEFACEYRLRRADREWRIFREYGYWEATQPDEAPTTLHSLVSDITAMRQAENRLEHLHKMEAFSRLVGGVAHDFNNLLTIIVGYTEMMLDASDTPEELRPYLNEVQLASQRATSLTTQLLAFNAPPPMLRAQTFDLNDALRDAGKMLRRLMGPQYRLDVLPAEARSPVRAARARWEQGFIEMAVLAREAMPDGGSLVFQVENVSAGHTINGEELGAGVLVTVAGTPAVPEAGTPPPHLTQAFLNCLDFVKLAGGQIIPREEGTALFLPAQDLPAVVVNKPSAMIAAKRPPGGETILFVEDDSTVRRLAVGALNAAGYRVLEAQSGDEALALAGNSAAPQADLMVTDVMLPGLDGKTLAARLAERSQTLRVLFTSGYPTATHAPVKGLESRSAYLQKPFSPKTLLGQVRSLLDRQP